MINKYYFDTDCLSAFLWVNGESILEKLYPGQIVLPAQVYDEVSKVPHLKERVDLVKRRRNLIIESMDFGSEEFNLYYEMITMPKEGLRIIGKGEAAGIAMAKCRCGTLASNNLRDVKYYVEKYNIKHITTGDILLKALELNMISEEDGNEMWKEMIKRRRMLPTRSFTEYININNNRD